MSEMWEQEQHPGQAEAHEPLTPEDQDQFGHGLGEVDAVGDEAPDNDERKPDVVTVTFESRVTYVVDLTTDPPNVKAEGGAQMWPPMNAELWAEGEILTEVFPDEELGSSRPFKRPADNDIYERAMHAVESAEAHGCECADDVLRKPGLPEVE